MNGRLHLTVRKNGKVIEHWDDHNLIVDGARQLMAKMAAGIVSTSITDLGVGSGNAPETVDDTALKNGVLIPIKTRTVNDKQARFDFFIGTDQANGINIIFTHKSSKSDAKASYQKYELIIHDDDF